MPELPEVEQVRRTLSPKITGQRISAVRVFYPERVFNVSLVDFRRLPAGAKVTGVERRGKLLLLGLDNGKTLLLGLGMTGRLSVETNLEPVSYLVAAIELHRNRFVKLHDVRRFSRLSLSPTNELKHHPFIAGLGREFDDRHVSPASLRRELGRYQSRSIKDALLDQSLIAGIGNIYANEILFAARLDPSKPAPALTLDEVKELLGQLRKILRKAIEMGGTTVRDFADVDGRSGKYAKHLRVYLKAGEDCPRCGKSSQIERIVLGGRGTFCCPKCQR